MGSKSESVPILKPVWWEVTPENAEDLKCFYDENKGGTDNYLIGLTC